MRKNIFITAALVGGLAFGIAAPAQAADATCTFESVLVSAAVEGSPAVYGEASVLIPARAPWVERVLVSAAVAEVSHVVQHLAEYRERVVVDSPAVPAVPAVDEVSHIVRHPAVSTVVHHAAVTTVVHHDAVTSTVHHPAVTTTDYTRYSWVGGKRGPQSGETPFTAPRNWQANGKKYDGSATGVVHQGNGNGSYFYWASAEVVSSPAWDETVTVSPAWDETVTVSPAWDETVVTPGGDEKVIDVAARPGTPAQPEVSHVERDLVREAYEETVIDVEARDAVYEDVEHPAEDAVYGERELIAEAVPAVPAVYTQVENCTEVVDVEVPTALPLADATAPTALPLTDTAQAAGSGAMPAALALTGGGVSPLVPVGAGVLVAGGLAALLLRRRRTQD